MNTWTSIVVSIIFLFFSYSLSAQLRLNENNQLFLNHDGNPIGTSSFTLSSENSGYTGMYINSAGDANRWPFYGYAVNGSPAAWQFYDSNTNQLATNVSFHNKMLVGVDSTTFLTDVVGTGDLRTEGEFTVGNLLNPLLKVNANDGLLFNAAEKFNANTSFTINTLPGNGFQGMYINGGAGQFPYYGYGIEGIGKAATAYDNTKQALTFTVAGTNLNPVMSLYNEQARIDGRLVLNNDGPVNSSDLVSLYSKGPYGTVNIDIEGGSNVFPFAAYSFSLDEEDKGGIYYLEEPDQVAISSGDLFTISTYGETVEIANVLKLQPYDNSNEIAYPGSIVYLYGNFYGISSDGSYVRLDNVSNSFQLEALEDKITDLVEQNTDLRVALKALLNKYEQLSDAINQHYSK